VTRAILDNWVMAPADAPDGAPPDGVSLHRDPASGMAMLMSFPENDGAVLELRLRDPGHDILLITQGALSDLAADLAGARAVCGPHSHELATFVPAGAALSLRHHRDGSPMHAVLLPAGMLATARQGGASAPFALRRDVALGRLACRMGRAIITAGTGGEVGARLAELTGQLAEALAVQQATPPDATPRHAIAPHKLRAVLRHVEGNLERVIGVRDMAARAGLSPYHFTRAFTAAVGTAPYRHVRRRRIARSEVLITRSTLPIGDIAEATGFASPAHFSQAFHQAIGMSPTTFRKVMGAGLVEGERSLAPDARIT